MLSYRTREEFALRFAGGICGEAVLGRSDPGAYLRNRGEVKWKLGSATAARPKTIA